MLKKKKFKKYIFPGATFLAGFCASITFGVGMAIGYVGTNIFCNKLVHTGKVKSVVLGHGNYNLHLHHWIMGLLLLLAGFVSQLIYTTPIFWIGCIGGLIFHDIHTDKEWRKIIKKKDITQK